jgi:hypothetical protein
MPRDSVTKQARSRSGLVVTMATVSAGNITNGFKCDWSPTAEIWVSNSDSVARTLTVQSGIVSADGLAVTGKTVTIPATSTVPVVAGPYLAEYEQLADRQLYFNLDALTGAKIAVVD